jgi:hypothetical protein
MLCFVGVLADDVKVEFLFKIPATYVVYVAIT